MSISISISIPIAISTCREEGMVILPARKKNPFLSLQNVAKRMGEKKIETDKRELFGDAIVQKNHQRRRRKKKSKKRRRIVKTND